jgi:hypothetical protein
VQFQPGPESLAIIARVAAVQGWPLSEVPLYMHLLYKFVETCFHRYLEVLNIQALFIFPSKTTHGCCRESLPPSLPLDQYH